MDNTIHEGALPSLSPVLMTVLIVSLGYIPMAIAIRSKFQRLLATVMIGGIISYATLTRLMLPLLYQ